MTLKKPFMQKNSILAQNSHWTHFLGIANWTLQASFFVVSSSWVDVFWSIAVARIKPSGWDVC